MPRLKGKRIPVIFSRSFLSKKRTKIALAVLAILALSAYPLLRIRLLQAEETILYPKICSGNWENAAAVAGPPPADPGIMTAYVSQPSGGGQELNCTEFSGEIPDNGDVVSAELEFVWSIGLRIMKPENASIEESYDPGAIIPETTEDIQTEPEHEIEKAPELEANTPLETSIPDNKGAEEIQEEPASSPDTVEPAVLPPTSLLPALIHAAQAQELEEDYANGTNLFDVSYRLGEKEPQVAGTVIRERLLKRFPVSLERKDIDQFALSLVSHMTIDGTSDVYLEAVRLILHFGDKPELSAAPQLGQDEIVDQISNDTYWVVLFKRKEGAGYELWYTDAKYKKFAPIPATLPKEPSLLEVALDLLTPGINKTEEDPIEQASSTENITSTASPELVKEESFDITQTSEPALNEDAVPQSNTESSELLPEPEQVKESSVQPRVIEDEPITWNFVAGPSLVNENSSLSLDENIIFWIDKNQGALYSFSIQSSSFSSQSYRPEEKEDYIFYTNEGGEEKRAIFDSTSRTFVFSKEKEIETEIESNEQ